ncbi:caspase family protein [Microcoleus sp. T3_A4]|uniref:nSTAND1 domain-containing NTPase n=1 Tax=Microcoleus sp. T3_A4 TaxID=2818968 RepID=UPI002FD169F9
MSWSPDKTNFDRNIAVVIGIDNYQNGIHPLKTAVNDVRAIADILEQEYEYQEVIRLFSEHGEATLAEINKLLFETLPNEVKLTEGDRLLFYFAGHGIARNSEDGPAGALIPQDAKLGKWETYLPMRKLNEALSKLDCHHLLVILDCCFAGNFRWSSSRNVISALETIHREHYDRFIRYPAWQAITSAAHNQEALDYTDERGIDKDSLHSPFAKALINGLKDMKADLTGDKVITAPELYLYLRDSLIGKDGYSELQTAGLWPLQKHDRGEFIFTLPGFVREKLKPAPPLDENNNPYRGLQSFDEQHARFFFGRQQLVNQLSVRVSRPVSQPEQQLTVVLGISGSGKSSLVKAGLISDLRKATNSFDITLIYACIITLAILEVNPDISLKFLPISYAHQWEILEPMRPGESPFDALAKAILPLVETQDKLADNLKENPEHLSLFLSTWSQTNPNRKLLLAIDQFEELITMSRQVNPANNQSEEKEDIQKQFLALLVNALKKCPQLHIVLTLRSDFEPRFIQSALKEYWTEARFPVRAMNLDELRQAIEQPAAEMALYFEPANLVNQLIDEVSQMPGALPLLSFTLSELYIKLHQAWVKDGKQERALTVDEEFYKQGGIAGSLSRRGNEIYNSLPDNAHRDTMRRVMLRMVEIEGGEPVRRRVPLSELNYANKQEPTQLDEKENQRVKVVLESLDKARLVVSGQETGEPYVEPAHDFLVKGWDKLQKWQEEEQENLLLQRRLTPAALDWKEKEQPPSLLAKTEPFLTSLDKKIDLTQDWLKQIQEKDIQQLLQEARVRLQSTTLEYKSQEQPSTFLNKTKPFLNLLDQTFGFAEDWLSKVRQKNTQENPREKKAQFLWNGNPYLDVLRKTLKSRDYWFNQVEAEFVQQSIWQRRRNVNLRWGIATGVILGLSWLTVWALREQRIGVIGQINTARQSSETGLRSNYLTLDTLIQSLQAGQSSKHWLLRVAPPDSQLQSQIVATLRRAVYLNKEQERWQLPPDEVVQDTLVSRNRKLLWATTKNKDTICVGDINNRQCNKIPTTLGSVIDAKFSPDGTKLALTSESFRGIYLWDWENGHFYQSSRLPGAVTSISFSPGSKTLAFISNYVVYLWTWNNPQPYQLYPLTDSQVKAQGITFKKDGTLLVATRDTNGTDLFLWNWNYRYNKFTGPSKFTGEFSQFPVDDVIINPNGENLVITFGSERTVGQISQFWNVGKRTPKEELGQVFRVSYSLNGEQLAITDYDGTVRLLDGFGNRVTELKGHQGLVSSFSFSPDGKQFLTAGNDNTIRLWNLESESLSQPQEMQNLVQAISFSPDGKRLATLEEGKIHLRDLSSGQDLKNLSPKYSPESKLILAPDAKQVAIIQPKDIRLLDLSSNQEQKLLEHDESVNSVSFNPDGTKLAIFEGTSDAPNSLRVLDFKRKQEKKFNWDEGFIQSAIWKSDTKGEKLLVAMADVMSTYGSVAIWDFFSRKQLAILRLGRLRVRDIDNISFNNDGSLVAIKAGQTMILWDLQSNQSVDFNLSSNETSSDDNTNQVKFGEISPDGSVIATIDEKGNAKLWHLGGFDNLLTKGCTRVRKYLATFNETDSDRHVCDGIENSRP